ncbi:MAG: helix-turn-helix transcriptional regulator [Acidobacteriaceae bacterium]
MDTQSSLVTQLRSKEYRDEFVAAQIRVGLPMQCRALRENREWTQPQLAEAAGMSQPRISEIERPGERKLNLDTLLRLASAFDVALQVRFIPFSKFVDDDDDVDLNDFRVPTFEEDLRNLEAEETWELGKKILGQMVKQQADTPQVELSDNSATREKALDNLCQMQSTIRNDSLGGRGQGQYGGIPMTGTQ